MPVQKLAYRYLYRRSVSQQALSAKTTNRYVKEPAVYSEFQSVKKDQLLLNVIKIRTNLQQ